jgi:hypothetical protein
MILTMARAPEDTAWIAAALHAVYEHDARFEAAEGFARWFSTVGRFTYGSDLVSAWDHWRDIQADPDQDAGSDDLFGRT